MKKKAHNYDYEKNIFIIETSNNMLETVTKQYREENRDKCIEKVNSIMKNVTNDYKKWAVINTDDYLKKKKIRKQKIKQVIEHMKELLKGLRS